MDIRKSALVNIIEGYKKANELIKAEKKIRLAALTQEDALCEYKDLCATWELSFKKDTLGRLEEWKISILIQRRQIINKLAGSSK